MSGRLVILRHKKWNVWNRDNQERVARDERLNSEKIQAEKEENDRIEQERNLDFLRSQAETAKDSDINDVENSPAEVVPFRLFEEIESKVGDSFTNAEYMKEKAQKEYLKKKRDGVAEWSLGDGSYEHKKFRPWYEQPSNTSIRSRDIYFLDDPIEKQEIEVEGQGKNSEDPIHLIKDFHSYEGLSIAESKQVEDSEHSNQSRQKNREERALKDKKNHKHKKKEKREKHKKHHHRHHRHSHELEKKSEKLTEIDLLRQQRLEREAKEKKRASILLAKADIYGFSAPSSPSNYEPMHYHSQYHPNIAKKKF